MPSVTDLAAYASFIIDGVGHLSPWLGEELMRSGARVEVQARAQKLRDDDRAKVGRKGFAEDSSVLDTSSAIFSARLKCRSADGDTHKSGRTASCYYELFLTASGMVCIFFLVRAG